MDLEGGLWFDPVDVDAVGSQLKVHSSPPDHFLLGQRGIDGLAEMMASALVGRFLSA